MISVANFGFSPIMTKTMGERLREARSKKFDSATKAAEALGIPPSTYRAYENGQNSFGPDEAERFARKFGSTAAYLLVDAAVVQAAPEDSIKGAQNMLRLWRLFDQIIELERLEDQDQIIEMVESRLRALSPRLAQRSRSKIGG